MLFLVKDSLLRPTGSFSESKLVRYFVPRSNFNDAEIASAQDTIFSSFNSFEENAMPASIANTLLRYPSHVSPAFPPKSNNDGGVPNYVLDGRQTPTTPPTNLLSPAITPPSTPRSIDSASEGTRKIVPVNPSDDRPQRLLERLPNVTCEVRARIPTTTGAEMFLHLYLNDVDNKEHLAIVFGSHIRSQSLFAVRPGETEQDRMNRGAYTGNLYPGRTSSYEDSTLPKESERIAQIDTSEPPLVRIHSECYTGETAWSARCDCGEQLDEAARLMSLPHSGGGVIIYLRQEGRGIGLAEKLKAYNLQDLGSDTVEANLLLRHPADARTYGLATAMLMDLGLGGNRGIRLLTNNPDKIRAVEGPNREVVVKERQAMVPLSWKTGGKQGIQGKNVEEYLSTKVSGGVHFLIGMVADS